LSVFQDVIDVVFDVALQADQDVILHLRTRAHFYFCR
jgi:hypothetical protein